MIGVGILVVVLAGGTPNKEGKPYDPANNGERGTKALVQTLERLGATVVVADRQPPPDTDVALALPGVVPPSRTAAMQSWVREGGTLVVADPESELGFLSAGQASVAGFSETIVERRECDIEALADVQSLKIDQGVRFGVPAGGGRCFTRQGASLIVTTDMGSGHLVAVGAPSVFWNSLLAEEDNARLAQALLVPRVGTRVAVLSVPPGEAVEEPSLGGLLGLGVKLGFLQIGVAFVVYSLFRGRRLGFPVVEPQPVLIAGSELTSAVGNLMQQTRNPSRAAGLLRADLRRVFAERLGLAADASPELMATTAAERSGADPTRVGAAVLDYPVGTDAELLSLAKLIDEVREEVLHGRPV